MRLQAYKGQINLIGKANEETKIRATAKTMTNINSELVECAEDDYYGEFSITIAYDSRYTTLKEIKDIYKQAKEG